MSPESPDDVLKIRDAVAAGYASDPTIRKWIYSGELPATRSARGAYIIRRADLDAMKARAAGRTGVQHHDPLDGLDAGARAWVEAVVADAPPLSDRARQRVLGALRAGLARTEAAESAESARAA